jgi:uncharacterized SAM-binding protein YcdF (DUF218 family)
MSHRHAHRLRILRDTDALHGLAVASLAVVLSGGLLYVYYAVRVWKIARGTPAWPEFEPGQPVRVLLFGKRCDQGEPDADFARRISRALALAGRYPELELLLLGGGPQPTEAQVAERSLRAGGLPDSTRLAREEQSRDTLENLRHARALLASGEGEVLLLSSRYHLARCSLFAGWLGIPHRLCAAEEVWRPTARERGRLALEAGYYLWVDVARRWAGLIGHTRMRLKVS